MVVFDLDLAHPWYQFVIRDQIWQLIEKYPQAALKRVRIYQPTSSDDVSLGHTIDKGIISLNEYWFSRPPEVLQREADSWPLMPNRGGRLIKWHGEMNREPEHCVTHEFFHVLADSVPDIDELAAAGWLEDTSDPSAVVSGYALTNPDEWWAESATAAELGLRAPSSVSKMLADIQAMQ